MNKIVLVTGATGYLGSWVVKLLLEKGYQTRITVRDKAKAEKYAFLKENANNSTGELEVFEADLLQPGSYNEAAEGSDAIFHIASPFTLRFKDPLKDLIEPAVNGTKNVLDAASASSTVNKVILTSSVAAVMGDNKDMSDKGLSEFTEDDFNDTSNENHQPYSYSKVRAELTAWDIAKQQDQWKLVVVNPAFIMGPPLSASTNSESIQFMKDMLQGKFRTGAPELDFGFVDVRDVAKAHILAFENEKAEGRHILVERVLNFWEYSKIIEKLFSGKYKLPMMKSPKLLLYLVGPLFGLTRKFVSNNVGHSLKLNNTKSQKQLGLSYTPLETTVKDMVNHMEDLSMVKA